MLSCPVVYAELGLDVRFNTRVLPRLARKPAFRAYRES
jgi:hypothetical protein